MEDLILQLKHQIKEQLNLEDIKIEDMDENEPLFEGELGLDSIDALEIIVLLEREYGIKLASQEEGKKVFTSIKTIAEFVSENQST